MRKTLVALLFCTFVAGSASAFPLWGFQIGWNTSKYRLIQTGSKQDRGLLFGFNAGLVYRTDGKTIRFQPTLLYTQKGAQNILSAPMGSAGVTNRLNYLQASVPVLYNKNIGVKNYTLNVGVGPYVAALLSGTSIDENLYSSEKTRTSYNIGSDPTDDLKRGDYGLSFVAGAKWKRANFSISYDYGLRNVSPAPATSLKNRVFALNFGVFLNKYGTK